MVEATMSAAKLDTGTLADIYRDLHAHPELSFQEHRTAAIVAQNLRALGYTVTENVGKTGVVGVLERGTGPAVMLRADMDALPVTEQTGLEYASTVTVPTETGVSGVMHACGHDVHTTALLGAAKTLAADQSWQGRLILVFQPAEEVGGGARAMVEDNLIERFGRPVVVLGQHVAPIPAGMLGMHSGVSYATSDALRVTIFGRGGHASRPDATVDALVLGAAIVTRLQTIVAREVSPNDAAVVSVGTFHAGEAPNIIPDRAVLQLSVRTFEPPVRDRVLEAISRIIRGEAIAAGADREPEIFSVHSFPRVVNDPDASDRVHAAFGVKMPQSTVIDPGPVTGSEDVGVLSEAAGAPLVYWLLGGYDPAKFANASSVSEMSNVVAALPSNHSPLFAPVIEPTLSVGVSALHTAALEWLNT